VSARIRVERTFDLLVNSPRGGGPRLAIFRPGIVLHPFKTTYWHVKGRGLYILRHRMTELDVGMAERRAISVPEAGRQVGLSRNGSYGAAARGEIPTMRFGRRLIVPLPAWERMLNEPARLEARRHETAFVPALAAPEEETRTATWEGRSRQEPKRPMKKVGPAASRSQGPSKEAT
jgi:hypothetical protein